MRLSPRLPILTLVAFALLLTGVAALANALSSANEPPKPPHTISSPREDPLSAYTEANRPDVEPPAGTPKALPIITNELSASEMQSAQAVALTDQALSARLEGHRFQIVMAEECPDVGNCDLVGIMDYDAGVCIHVQVDRNQQKVISTEDGWCAPSESEILEARRIAENDNRVHEVIAPDKSAHFIAGQTAIPEMAEAGHRYIGVRWSLANGRATAEFTVDLTTQEVRS